MTTPRLRTRSDGYTQVPERWRKFAILVLQPMAELPVADAVSFEFYSINVTAQHVMAQTVPLTRLLAFYDQFIKGYRGSQVPAH